MDAHLRRVLALAAVVLFASCDQYGAVAPDGAAFRIVAVKDTLRPPRDSTPISAAVLLESGDLVRYDADVTFATSLGGLCLSSSSGPDACTADSLGMPALKTRTVDGVAKVLLRGGAISGTANVTVQSGDAKDSVLIPIVPLPAP